MATIATDVHLASPMTSVSEARTAGEMETAARAMAKAIEILADHLAATRPGSVYRELLGLVEGPLLAHVLTRTDGNQVQAARLLGVNRNTLHKRGRQLGLLPARQDRRAGGQAGSAA
jgi:DNA-binding protein Fis